MKSWLKGALIGLILALPFFFAKYFLSNDIIILTLILVGYTVGVFVVLTQFIDLSIVKDLIPLILLIINVIGGILIGSIYSLISQKKRIYKVIFWVLFVILIIMLMVIGFIGFAGTS